MAESSPLQKLKDALRNRGCHGGLAFIREFKRMDSNRDKFLSAQELKRGLEKLGIGTTDEELTAIIQHFDKNGDGKIDTDEFVEGVTRPEVPQARKSIIDEAFKHLDKNDDGFIAVGDLKGSWKVGDDIQTDEKALQQILDMFDYGGNQDGKVTKLEFLTYYANLSKVIPSDDTFEKVVKAQWQLQ